MQTCLFKQFTRCYSPIWRTLRLNNLVKRIKDHFVKDPKGQTQALAKAQTIDKSIKSIEILSSIRKYASEPDQKERVHPIVISIACYLAKDLANGTRGVIALPTPIDRDSKILAFVPPEMEAKAKAAGALIAGGSDLIPQIIEGKLEFNRCVATKGMIPVITKIARYLGPKGLMPTIKTGTLTDDIEAAIKSSIDKMPFKIARNGMMNNLIARTNFTDKQILENINAVMNHLECFSSNAKKGKFIRMGRLGIPSDRLYKMDLRDFIAYTGKKNDSTIKKKNEKSKNKGKSIKSSLLFKKESIPKIPLASPSPLLSNV